MTIQKKGYLIIRNPIEEEDLLTIKELIEEEEDENIFSINEQGNKLVIGINYEDLEEISQIAATIVYNCISVGINSININYCGKETKPSSNTKTKGSHNNLSSNNFRKSSFDNYISSSFTN